MKKRFILLLAALLLSGCAAKAPAEPVPAERENLAVSVSFGDADVPGSYTGWVLSGLPEGEGSFRTEDGITFTGRFSAGEAAEGTGENLPLRLDWDGLSYTGRYTGEIKAGLPDGEGAFTGESATGFALELTGGWEAGLPLGNGHIRAELYTALCNGTERPGSYEGQALDGLPHGEGSFQSQDGLGPFTYTGQWEDGAFHGQGTLTYAGNRQYVRQGTFTDGGFTPTYFEALNTVGSYEPLFVLTDSQKEFLEQYPGLWDGEHDRRNYLKSEYSKILDYRYYPTQIFKTPEKFENIWIRINNCRLIDRRAVTFDNGMTVNVLTAVDGTYMYTFQCYLVGDIPENLQQRSRLDMYATALGLSQYTNPMGGDVPCALLLVGDIRIR